VFLRAASLDIGHGGGGPGRRRRKRQHDGRSGIAGEGRGERAFNTLARLAVVDVEAAATEEESTATFAILEFKANKFAHFYYRLLMKKVRKTL
jgi:hypothetical protein